MIDPDKITPEIAEQADRLVDKRGYSFADAYRELGVPLSGPAADSTGPGAREAARQADEEFYAKEFYLTGNTPLSPDQVRRNQAGAAAAREILSSIRPQPDR